MARGVTVAQMTWLRHLPTVFRLKDSLRTLELIKASNNENLESLRM